jgi:uncharacterized protein (TIGR02145 family)
MPTDTKVNDLKINVLSEAQYEQIASPSATELYLVPETVDTTPTSGSTNPITSGGVYNALQNIPEQEQSDWNETDATDPAYIKNKPTLGTAAAKNVPSSGDAATTEVVMGDDTRLSDARTPTSHTHGNITNDGKVGSASGKILTTGTGGAVQASDSITKSMISDFPALAAVATSGSYNDLTNKPTIPTVPTHRTVNHEQITDSSFGDINLHDGFYFPNAVQDYDGNWYGAVVIGDQVWLGENLRTTHLADGTVINAGGNNTSSTIRYYYDNSSSNIPLEKRGYLYNWSSVMNGSSASDANPSGVQGVAPNGWHVPSVQEYDELFSYIGKQNRYIYSDNSSYVAKSLASTSYWSTNSSSGAVGNEQSKNNTTLFNAYPLGRYNSAFELTFTDAIFITTSAHTNGNPKGKYIKYTRSYVSQDVYGKAVGLSVRCVSDLTPLQFRDWYVKTYGTLQHKLDELPSMSGNSGKVLAVNGTETDVEWVRPVTVYSGSSEPSASLGEDGDIFILAS